MRLFGWRSPGECRDADALLRATVEGLTARVAKAENLTRRAVRFMREEQRTEFFAHEAAIKADEAYFATTRPDGTPTAADSSPDPRTTPC